MTGIQLQQSGLDHLSRFVLTTHPDEGLVGTDRINHDFYDLIKVILPQLSVLTEDVVLNISQYELTILFPFFSHLFSGYFRSVLKRIESVLTRISILFFCYLFFST